MGLNIKNEDVHRSVRELATRLGVSQTSAVELAVRAQLDGAPVQEDRRTRLERVIAEAQESFAGVDLRAVEAELYDPVTGLPR